MDTTLPETFKAVIAKRDGSRGDLRDVPLQKPGKNELLIKVHYASVNPSDLGTMMGFYPVYPPPNNIPERKECPTGMEGCGEIVAIGEDCIVKHEVGDLVSFLSLGSWAQYCIVPSERAAKNDPSLSREAAACTINSFTCLLMYDLAVQGKHKTIIQNAASSALGKMVIRYFKMKGIKTINIVRKNSYFEELLKEGGDYVLNQEDDDFDTKLQELAAKEEATLGFDCIGGDMLGRILYAMPPNSEIRLLGAFSEKPIMAGLQDLLFLNKTIKGFWGSKIVEGFTQEQTYKYMQEVQTHLKDILRSEIAKVFKMSEYREAVKSYKELSGKGKILINPHA